MCHPATRLRLGSGLPVSSADQVCVSRLGLSPGLMSNRMHCFPELFCPLALPAAFRFPAGPSLVSCAAVYLSESSHFHSVHPVQVGETAWRKLNYLICDSDICLPAIFSIKNGLDLTVWLQVIFPLLSLL